jgi:hypothetical protein
LAAAVAGVYTSSFQLRGSPDIICVIRGIYVGIEVKGSAAKQSGHQKDFQ